MEKAKAIALIQNTDETRFEINVTITSKYANCFGCRKEYNKRLLVVRHSRKVPILQVPRKFCPKCKPQIDYVVKHWKGREAENGEILSCRTVRR